MKILLLLLMPWAVTLAQGATNQFQLKTNQAPSDLTNQVQNTMNRVKGQAVLPPMPKGMTNVTVISSKKSAKRGVVASPKAPISKMALSPKAASQPKTVPMARSGSFSPASLSDPGSAVEVAYTCDFNFFHCPPEDSSCVKYDILNLKATQVGGTAMTIDFVDSVIANKTNWGTMVTCGVCPANRQIEAEFFCSNNQRLQCRFFRTATTQPPVTLARTSAKMVTNLDNVHITPAFLAKIKGQTNGVPLAWVTLKVDGKRVQ